MDVDVASAVVGFDSVFIADHLLSRLQKAIPAPSDEHSPKTASNGAIYLVAISPADVISL